MSLAFCNPGPASSLPLTHAVKALGLVFISGQLPITASGGYPAEFEAQVRQVFINLEAALKSAEVGFQQVTKTTVFLRDMDQFAEMNRIYAEYFYSNPPARSTIQVARLPKDAMIEIEAIAVG